MHAMEIHILQCWQIGFQLLWMLCWPTCWVTFSFLMPVNGTTWRAKHTEKLVLLCLRTVAWLSQFIPIKYACVKIRETSFSLVATRRSNIFPSYWKSNNFYDLKHYFLAHYPWLTVAFNNVCSISLETHKIIYWNVIKFYTFALGFSCFYNNNLALRHKT